MEPEDFYDEIAETGRAFRCDRCDALWPVRFMAEQDGFKLCTPRCLDTIGRIDAANTAARAVSYAASRTVTVQDEPWTDPFDGGVSIRDIDPATPIALAAGGAAVTVTLYGYNLTSADTLTYENVNITDSVAPAYAADTKSVVLTVVAGAPCPAGDYGFTYNDVVFTGVFRVR